MSAGHLGGIARYALQLLDNRHHWSPCFYHELKSKVREIWLSKTGSFNFSWGNRRFRISERINNTCSAVEWSLRGTGLAHVSLSEDKDESDRGVSSLCAFPCDVPFVSCHLEEFCRSATFLDLSLSFLTAGRLQPLLPLPPSPAWSLPVFLFDPSMWIGGLIFMCQAPLSLWQLPVRLSH